MDKEEYKKGYIEGWCAVLGENHRLHVRVLCRHHARVLNQTDFQVGLLDGVSDALGVDDIVELAYQDR